MTNKIVAALCLTILAALFGGPALAAGGADDSSPTPVLVTRDESGHVQRRVALLPDGSRHTTAASYWPHTDVVRRTIDEDLDRTGRPTGRTVQEFDSRGRLLESRAVTIDATGRESGTRTRFTYGPRGRVGQSTTRLER